jgi:hypothetical protein
MALKRGIRAGQIGNAIKLPIVGRAHCLMPAGRASVVWQGRGVWETHASKPQQHSDRQVKAE